MAAVDIASLWNDCLSSLAPASRQAAGQDAQQALSTTAQAWRVATDFFAPRALDESSLDLNPSEDVVQAVAILQEVDMISDLLAWHTGTSSFARPKISLMLSIMHRSNRYGHQDNRRGRDPGKCGERIDASTPARHLPRNLVAALSGAFWQCRLYFHLTLSSLYFPALLSGSALPPRHNRKLLQFRSSLSKIHDDRLGAVRGRSSDISQCVSSDTLPLPLRQARKPFIRHRVHSY